MKRANRTDLQQDETLRVLLKEKLESFQSSILSMETSCLEALEVEMRLYESLEKSIDGGFLSCFALFPLLLQMFSSILNDMQEWTQEKSNSYHEIIFSQITQSVLVYETYVTQYHNACCSSDLPMSKYPYFHLLNAPLNAMDVLKDCVLVLEQIFPRDQSIENLIAKGEAANAKRRHQRRLQARLDKKAPSLSLYQQELALYDVLFVTLNDGIAVKAEVIVFKSSLVIQQSDTQDILLAIDSPQRNQLLLYETPDNIGCTLVQSHATYHIQFLTQAACTFWIKEAKRRVTMEENHIFKFDLQDLLASNDDFPKGWLITDTETSNQNLCFCDTFWLHSVDGDDFSATLHQFYLMNDMVIYGKIDGYDQCRYIGYILGEHVVVHDPPRNHSIGGYTFELEINHQEEGSSSLLISPLHAGTRQKWIEKLNQIRNSLMVSDSAESEDLVQLDASHRNGVPSPRQENAAMPVSQFNRTDSEEKDSLISSATTISSTTSSRMLGIDEITHSSSETEIESDQEDESFDSMLCMKQSRKRSFVVESTTTKGPSPRMQDTQQEVVTFAATREPKRSRTLKSEGDEIKSRNVARPIQFESEAESPSVASEPHDGVPSTQEMEGKAIEFLQQNASIESAIQEPIVCKASPEEAKEITLPSSKQHIDKPSNAHLEEISVVVAPLSKKSKSKKPKAKVNLAIPSTQDMEGGAIQFLRDVPFTVQTLQESPRGIRIALTGFSDSQSLIIKITAIESATYEDDVMKATHVVAPSGVLKRTVKILCGISCCLHILDEKWLHNSAKLGRAEEERLYCLSDPVKEQLWGCSLEKTMYNHTLSQRKSLLCNRGFFITKHKTVLPPPEDLEKIILCAGGHIQSASNINRDTLIITSPEASNTAAVKKILKLVTPLQCYTPELLLRCILTQRLDLNENHVGIKLQGRKNH